MSSFLDSPTRRGALVAVATAFAALIVGTILVSIATVVLLEPALIPTGTQIVTIIGAALGAWLGMRTGSQFEVADVTRELVLPVGLAASLPLALLWLAADMTALTKLSVFAMVLAAGVGMALIVGRSIEDR